MTCQCRVCIADLWARRLCWGLFVVAAIYFAAQILRVLL